MKKLRQFMSELIHGEPIEEPHAHFHQGPQGSPAVCHDADCPIPRLTV